MARDSTLEKKSQRTAMQTKQQRDPASFITPNQRTQKMLSPRVSTLPQALTIPIKHNHMT